MVVGVSQFPHLTYVKSGILILRLERQHDRVQSELNPNKEGITNKVAGDNETRKTLKLGDSVELSFNGEDFKVKIVQTTVVNFMREYLVEFADGSKKWFVAADFRRLKN
jgi:hypothetical protein